MHFETCSGERKGFCKFFEFFSIFHAIFSALEHSAAVCKIVFIISNPRKKMVLEELKLERKKDFHQVVWFPRKLELWMMDFSKSLCLVFLFWRFTDWYSILAVQTTRQPPTTFFSYKSLWFWSETCTLYVWCTICMYIPNDSSYSH